MTLTPLRLCALLLTSLSLLTPVARGQLLTSADGARADGLSGRAADALVGPPTLPAASDALRVGPPAPPLVKVGLRHGPFSMLVERRYQNDPTTGQFSRYSHRFITGPVMAGGQPATLAQLHAAAQAGVWPAKRSQPRNGAERPNPRGPGGPSGCPDDVEITVLTLNQIRGELLPADLDCNGVYEPADLALLAAALAGPSQPTGGGSLCKLTDHDNDGDTDLADLAILQDSGGPAVPTRLEYALDGGAWQPLFGGGDVAAGAPPAVIGGWTAGQVLTLRASAAYPAFGGGWHSSSVVSDDPQRVLVLLNGDNLAQRLTQVGAQPPFAGQSGLQQILTTAGYLSAGVVQLAAHESLVFYELGTANPLSPAFDFQDLGLLLALPCDTPTEIVLRDSIGPDSSWTDGNFPFFSARSRSANPFLVPIKIVASDDIQLKTLRMVVSQGGELNFDQLGSD